MSYGSVWLLMGMGTGLGTGMGMVIGTISGMGMGMIRCCLVPMVLYGRVYGVMFMIGHVVVCHDIMDYVALCHIQLQHTT